MQRYIARQVIYTVPVMIVASVLVFYSLRIAPGDPVNAYLNPLALEQARAETRTRLGLNLPIYEQYFVYMKHIFQGNLGSSLLTGKDVTVLIGQYGPRTLVLALTGLTLSYLVAVPLGVLAAVKRDSIWDHLSMFLASLGMGIPSFWLALLLILLFSVRLQWLPIEGYGDLRHLVLPAIVLAAEGAAVTSRLMRSSMLEQLGQDYVRTHYAKGLTRWRVLWVHVLRNALLPIVSLLGLRIGWLIGYTLIVETVFHWPGLGFLLVSSVISRDYPVAQTLSLVLMFCVLLGTFVANVAHAGIDPRVRGE